MMKLLKLWSTFGLKVMSGYMAFIETHENAAIYVIPIMLLGFTIPWVMVYVILLALNIIQGWFVYDLTIKEQVDCIKEGFMNGIKHSDKYL